MPSLGGSDPATAKDADGYMAVNLTPAQRPEKVLQPEAAHQGRERVDCSTGETGGCGRRELLLPAPRPHNSHRARPAAGGNNQCA
ncbi:MAG: hypothetical protein MZV49_25925 [Rhodopseudomonas palustris]|nr:hypothetical protein [Rhodopseudomonas palustris]